MILEVNNLTCRYGRGPLVFQNASFSVDKGEVLSILGVNGAGKSTLLNCIAGLFHPESGNILMEGRNLRDMTMRDIAKVIGYVPQIHTPSYAYTVREFVVMGRTPYIGAFALPSKNDYEIADAAIERMRITHLRNKAYTQISGGERQQVTIARAIAQQARIILLDEPTAHLDYGNQYRTVVMVKELAAEGYTLIMTTHNPDHAVILGGKTAVLKRGGELCVGPAEEMLSGDKLTSLYGLRIKTEYDRDAGREVCIVC